MRRRSTLHSCRCLPCKGRACETPCFNTQIEHAQAALQFALLARALARQCGRRSMAGPELPKLKTWVRFPSPAPGFASTWGQHLTPFRARSAAWLFSPPAGWQQALLWPSCAAFRLLEPRSRHEYCQLRFSEKRSVSCACTAIALSDCFAERSATGHLMSRSGKISHEKNKRRSPDNGERLLTCGWWSWRELNPRPQAFLGQIYMFSVLVWISRPTSRRRTLCETPAPLNLALCQGTRHGAS